MSGRYTGSHMRAYKILPTAQIHAASLEAFKRLSTTERYLELVKDKSADSVKLKEL